MTEEYEIQRSPAWHEFRRNHIGSSDAPIIMNGFHFGKSCLDLYNEKTNDLEIPDSSNYAMRRGVELEPLALAKFEAETGYLMTPRVCVHPKYKWMSASLDALELDNSCGLEIKCPGKEDHALALKGIVPEKYVPQLTHIMMVTGLDWIYYMSYVSDEDYTIFKVQLDNDYADRLLQAESAFWQRVQDRNPPEPCNRDSEEIDSEVWKYACKRYTEWNNIEKELQSELDTVKLEKERCKNELIALADNRSVHGAGIKLSKCTRRGSVNYAEIPELQGVELDKYRNMIEYWRVSFKGDEDV